METAGILSVFSFEIIYDSDTEISQDFNIHTATKYFKGTLDSNGGDVLLSVGTYNGFRRGLTIVSLAIFRISKSAQKLTLHREKRLLLLIRLAADARITGISEPLSSAEIFGH